MPGFILRFSKNGNFRNVFSSNLASGCAVHLHRPEGLAFGPDGNLYVTSFGDPTNPSDTDKILVFNSNGQCLRAINLWLPGQERVFAQALLFGPNGRLFVPLTNIGGVRRYDVSPCGNDRFDDFVPRGTLAGQPWFLTFGSTNPSTLAYQRD
jgi:glucose/arabinose dehydrogenase